MTPVPNGETILGDIVMTDDAPIPLELLIANSPLLSVSNTITQLFVIGRLADGSLISTTLSESGVFYTSCPIMFI
ncbi:hypothetical protein JYT96_03150 [Gammaproteobacteria bacterium AH-315-C21]|nr:hypothetical protein [Gammaproteobacteria bacterium AH-315-C21]